MSAKTLYHYSDKMSRAIDMDHMYIDGTKIVANANKYSWVWKKTIWETINWFRVQHTIWRL